MWCCLVAVLVVRAVLALTSMVVAVTPAQANGLVRHYPVAVQDSP
jgi:hypothetical protein